MRFEVEAVMPNVGSGVVFARQLVAGDFTLGPASKLGGVHVQPHVTSPRALNPDGSPRFDLFAFTLRSKADLAAFVLGQVVELEPGQGT